MISITPFYISPKGGSITCFRGDGRRIFKSCLANHCVYASDLHSAKVFLDNLEGNRKLPSSKVVDKYVQRKTTLKWNSDGELSSIDMARILDKLANPKLTECELTCDSDVVIRHRQKVTSQETLPITAWIP